MTTLARIPARVLGAARGLLTKQHKVRGKLPARPSGTGAKKVRIGKRRLDQLELKLWSGHSGPAKADLLDLARNQEQRPDDRQRAYRLLIQWNMENHMHQAALELSEEAWNIEVEPDARIASLRVDALIAAGRSDDALTLAEKMLSASTEPSLAYLDLTRALYATGSASAGVEILNRWLQEHGLHRIVHSDNPSFLNVVCESTPLQAPQDKKVSVIIPAYNAAETLENAVQSVLNQTWKNVEIIIVDDCSSDETASVAAQLCEANDAIRLLSLPANKGAYFARNLGLSASTGDFVTVHDADDWSHSQRLELQVADLVNNPDRQASIATHCRVDNNFCPVRSHYLGAGYLKLGHSSLLVRRQVFSKLGEWDTFRVGADKEFIFRIRTMFGARAIIRTLPQVPLYYSLHDPNSLTQNRTTHVTTSYRGLRKEYRERWQHWHKSQQKLKNLRLQRRSTDIPFSLYGLDYKNPSSSYDVVIITDMTMRGGTRTSVLSYIEVCRQMGIRVGLFHAPRYDRTLPQAIDDKYREIINAGQVGMILPSETVTTNLLMVYHPPVFNHVLDGMPDFRFGRLIVLVNQMPSQYRTGDGKEYDPGIVRNNLLKVFGTEGTWIANSPLVKRLMEEDSRLPRPHPEVWGQLVDLPTWYDREPQWRGKEGGLPHVGRHTRDSRAKWPSDPKVIRSAYGPQFRVSVLGGAKVPKSIAPSDVARWRVYEFDSIASQDFLHELDFYVYYTHPDYIEENSRSITEALASGIPVICGPEMEEVFGNAVLCTPPEEAQHVIELLWKNRDAYMHQARVGRDYITNECSYARGVHRISKFLKNVSTCRSSQALAVSEIA